MSKMSSCCPICLKGVERSTCSSRESEYDNGDKDQFGKRDEFQQMFFRLFERYVDLEDDDGGRRNRVTFDQLNLVGFLSCGQCLKLMESFCQLFDQLKTIELFLNWKVETLKNLMKCAQRVPSRMAYFREFVGKLEVEENPSGGGGLSVNEFLTELVIKWRRSLIEKCSRKLSSALPSLSIAKLKPSKASSVIKGPSLPDPIEFGSFEIISYHPQNQNQDRSGYPITVEKQFDTSTDHRTEAQSDFITDSGNSSNHSVSIHHLESLLSKETQIMISDIPTSSTATTDSPSKQNINVINDMDDELSNQHHESKPESPSPVDSETSTIKTEPTDGLESEYDSNPVPKSNSDRQLHVVVPDLETESERNPKDAANEISPTSHNLPERKSILRATHRCHHCRKTFSSVERLQLHVQEGHKEGYGAGWPTLDSEFGSDNDHDDEDCESDNDNMSQVSSSSGTGDDNFEPFTQPENGKGKYTLRCPECYVTVNATKPYYLKCHMRKHETAHFRFKCPDCNDLFKYNRDLLLHRRDGETCSYDPATSIRVEILVPSEDELNVNRDDEPHFSKVHAVIELPQEIFICQIDNCGVTLYTSEDLETHKKLHGTFPCNFCKVEVSSAPDLSLHELQHQKAAKIASQRYICPRCDFTYCKLFEYLAHHAKTHLNLTLNEPLCAICKTHSNCVNRDGDKALVTHFKKIHDLANVTIPEDIKRCAIGNCNAYFLTSPQLIDHLRYHHGIGEFLRVRKYLRKPKPAGHSETGSNKRNKPLHLLGKHNCRDCDKSFFRLDKLRDHRLKHHVPQDKIIPCSFPKCTKTFESQMDLERHIKQSSNAHRSLTSSTRKAEKVFVECPTCGKSVSGSDPCYLRQHLKSHETSNVCEQCGKVFKQRANLDRHKLTHSGPDSWSFQCDICSKKCMSKPKLEEHLRTHTKDKSFICQVCGNKYAHRHNLRIHFNSKHGDQVQDIPLTRGPKRKIQIHENRKLTPS